MAGPVLPKSSIDLGNLLGFPPLEITQKVQGLFAFGLYGHALSWRAGGTGSQRGVAWGRLVGIARDARDEPLLWPGRPWDVPSPRLAAVAGGWWPHPITLAPGWVLAPPRFLGQNMWTYRAWRSQVPAERSCIIEKGAVGFHGICKALARRSTC